MSTQAGEVLYASAMKVFANLDRAKASIEMLRDRVVGDLGIGCSTIPSLTLFTGIASSFFSKIP